MFQVDRARALDRTIWRDGGSMYYVQCSQHPNVDHCTAFNYQKGALADHEVEDWLEQKGRFVPPPLPTGTHPATGGFRILICGRQRQTEPPRPSISRDSFLKLEKAFKLSPATLPALESVCGLHSRRFNYSSNSDTPESLDIIIKVTQKVIISNALLSLNHSFDTNWTNAFLCGHKAVDSSIGDPYNQGRLDHLLATIESCMHLWSNPLFLPVAVLRNTSSRLGHSTVTISDTLVELEIDVGVTLTGQTGYVRPREDWPASVDIKSATFRLHNVNAQTIFVGYVSAWSCDCARFLIDLASEVDVHKVGFKRSTRMLREILQHELSSVTNIDRFIGGYKERIQAQINVLYSASSQVDNDMARKDTQTNIRIAMLTKRDSVAMIAFTFITALFLPGTAIATMFSMPVFDWESTSTHVTVSTNFWIYWVITVPLTVAVLAGWYFWYRYKNRQWQEDTAAEVKKVS